MKAGQPVQISAHSAGVLVVPCGGLRLTLAQRLSSFDPEIHGGEAMPTAPFGKEVL
jgi:hypothetical protein